MANSPYYKRAGAFLNLEAMGGGGLPIAFQHTGKKTCGMELGLPHCLKVQAALHTALAATVEVRP